MKENVRFELLSIWVHYYVCLACLVCLKGGGGRGGVVEIGSVGPISCSCSTFTHYQPHKVIDFFQDHV